MERRRFFRIDDMMEFHCERLTEEQLDAAELTFEPTDAQSMLASFDRQIQTIIESARIQAPAVASLADMLNRKMNYIIATLDIGNDLLELVVFKARHASLSACGIAFDSDTDYQSGEQLRLEMRLNPNNVQLILLAKVVTCEVLVDATSERRFHLSLNFVGISAADQELLIQYIVRRQSQLLQDERTEREHRAINGR